VFDVRLYGMEAFNSFWVQSEELYNSFAAMGVKARLDITFSVENRSYRLAGELIDKRMEETLYLTLIEQIAPIEKVSNREHFREEMRLHVNVYELSPQSLQGEPMFKPSKTPVLSCEVFDISAGGVCLVNNDVFNSPSEPYFLLEFNLRGKDYFLLPSKLVRKGHCPQTSLFKFDYGFDFIFDQFPDEKHRLSDAIFSAKLERL
ncbi:MAG: hypothetical protein FWG06_00595, partial [Clostridiales bacterium]|nr:hypothetical protein [Clostridiales bacterium]